MSVFRAYDVRGVYGKELTEKLVEDIGRAYATYLNADTAFVGMDGRLSSPLLKNAFIKGLNDTGCDAIDIGLVPTPVLYFSAAFYNKIAAAMITASHNPKEYNGVKLCRGLRTLGGEELKKIERIIKENAFRIGAGKIEKKEVLPDYIDYLSSKFEFEGLKIVIDAMNGVGALALEPILKRLGNDVTTLNGEPDGNFPKGDPNPDIEERLSELKETVIRENADIGVATDGDADRVVFVDDKGKILSGTQSSILFIKDVLAKQKGKVVFDIMASELIRKTIESSGGVAMISPTGHTNIRRILFDYNAVFAAEASGHYFFHDDYFGYDDGIYAALRMAEIVAMKGSLSKLVSELPSWYPIKADIHCPEEKKEMVVMKLKQIYNDWNPITIDGVRVSGNGGWFAIRPSNTEDIIRIKGEFDSKESAEKMLSELKAVVEKLIKEN